MSDIIQVTYGELIASFESEVMKAVQQVGINVNKEELLKALELADKLVHCKDCKWSDPNNEGDYDCKCHIPTFRVPKDGYCNFGERRDRG